MPTHEITILDTGDRYRCPEGRTLLEGMEALGRGDIPIGCRGGGCGVCKVHVVRGTVTRRVMSRAHVTEEEEAAGFVLACRARPTSDVQLAVVGQMRKQVCEAATRAPPKAANP
jgi:ferredoxin